MEFNSNNLEDLLADSDLGLSSQTINKTISFKAGGESNNSSAVISYQIGGMSILGKANLYENRIMLNSRILPEAAEEIVQAHEEGHLKWGRDEGKIRQATGTEDPTSVLYTVINRSDRGKPRNSNYASWGYSCSYNT